uniref:Septin-type G domain-containing protein n=1 Tax=Macrostomum lignano TaxID=282301 RepID=A0A1I8FNK5_9PLAT
MTQEIIRDINRADSSRTAGLPEILAVFFLFRLKKWTLAHPTLRLPPPYPHPPLHHLSPMAQPPRPTPPAATNSRVQLGFANLPDQMHRKAVKKGFNFTLMVPVPGRTCTRTANWGSVTERINKTTEIEKRYIELDEKGVKLRLTYFKDECGLNRKNIIDHRVHCCLYFIIRELKERVMGDLERPQDSNLSECRRLTRTMMKRPRVSGVLRSGPASVRGHRQQLRCRVWRNGRRRVRGRQYPWGVVEVENPRHCDFTKLRIFLLGTHMQDLKDLLRRSKNTSDAQFEALVDTEGLLKEKEDEIRRMQQLLQHLQSNKSSQGGSADGSGRQLPAAAVTSANSAGGAAARLDDCRHIVRRANWQFVWRNSWNGCRRCRGDAMDRRQPKQGEAV